MKKSHTHILYCFVCYFSFSCFGKSDYCFYVWLNALDRARERRITRQPVNELRKEKKHIVNMALAFCSWRSFEIVIFMALKSFGCLISLLSFRLQSTFWIHCCASLCAMRFSLLRRNNREKKANERHQLTQNIHNIDITKRTIFARNSITLSYLLKCDCFLFFRCLFFNIQAIYSVFNRMFMQIGSLALKRKLANYLLFYWHSTESVVFIARFSLSSF